jgi:glycosyltransferase involved in cell wall biosynthesis
MLSIVIPVKNEAKSLPLILGSIKAQSFTDLEVIVAISADTTDDSRRVAEAFGARTVVGGMPGPGRNRGAEVAKGDVILFLDADIILPPGFLAGTVAEFKRRRLGVATCFIQPLSERLDDKFFHDVFNLYMKMVAEFSPHAPGFCIFAQHDLHDAIKGFDEEIKLAEDHDYVMRAARIGRYGILKSFKIPVSVRRFERDGRLNIAMKMLLAEIYLQTKGNIKTDIFRYRFAHFDEPKKTTAVELKEQLEEIAKLARARARKIGTSLKKEVKLPLKKRVRRITRRLKKK